MTGNPILEVRNLEKHFHQQAGIVDSILGRGRAPVQAVDGVSFTLAENESMAVIGESGCGKTTLLLTLMGLHEFTDGEILFRGKDVSNFTKKDWKEFRRNVQVIFQDPFNSLDPKLTVRDTLLEPLKIHGLDNKQQRVEDILQKVELRPPEQFLENYPNDLSGGEKQRVSIARALVLEPDVILADEPVSMLDVSTQASLLQLLEQLIQETGVAMIYISHDLSTVSYVAREINVMYLGRIVEQAPTEQLLNDPKHPYSEALISAIPIPDPHHDRERTTLSGAAQDPIDLGEGCRFRDRCPERMDICETTPKMVDVADRHSVACHLHYDHEAYVNAQASRNEADPMTLSTCIRDLEGGENECRK